MAQRKIKNVTSVPVDFNSLDKYTYQAAPNAPLVKFDRRKAKTKFGTVYPKWAWSEWYRKSVHKHVLDLHKLERRPPYAR